MCEINQSNSACDKALSLRFAVPLRFVINFVSAFYSLIFVMPARGKQLNSMAKNIICKVHCQKQAEMESETDEENCGHDQLFSKYRTTNCSGEVGPNRG